jgi:hypothetical protein
MKSLSGGASFEVSEPLTPQPAMNTVADMSAMSASATADDLAPPDVIFRKIDFILSSLSLDFFLRCARYHVLDSASAC